MAGTNASGGISFSVATNFTPELVDGLAVYPVKELFGRLSSDGVGGGRAAFMLPSTGKAEFRKHVFHARSKGIGFNYLINAACLDNAEYTRSWHNRFDRILDFIEDCGIGSVTVSLPFLLAVIKKRRPGLKVRVGVYARVDNPVKARFYEELGADEITLESISVNRDFEALGRIRESVGCGLQLIANSNCMLTCPLSGQHMVNLSHASQNGHSSRGFMIDWCALVCSAEKLREPSNYLRSEFIRPEDLKAYTALGYNSFKILERGAPTSAMVERVRAYSDGRFDGNLLDLIQPYGFREKRPGTGGLARLARFFFRPGEVPVSGILKLRRLAEMRGLTALLAESPVRIHNRALDGFLDGLRERGCGRLDCGRCGYCASYARKAVRIDERYRAELLGLYSERLGEMYSGGLWKGL